MRGKDKEADTDKLYRKKKKEKVKTDRVEGARRQRNDILDAMMQKARTEPSYKTLSRIIQVLKAVFVEKIDQSKDKKGKGEDDDEEMEQE